MNVLATLTRPLEWLPGLGANATMKGTLAAAAVYISVLGGIAALLIGVLIWNDDENDETVATDMTPTPELRETPTPEPTETPTPDPTPEATPEPDPTPTPAVTPEPTPEPEPTPDETPTPEPDPAIATELTVEEYREWLDDMRETLGSSLGHFRELRADADAGDSEWKDEVEREIGIWRSLCESAGDITPPDELDEAHDMITSGLYEISIAADRVERSLQTKDSDNFEDARQHIAIGVDLISRGDAMVGEVEREE